MGASGGGAGLGARGHGGSAVVPQALAPSATRDVQDATIGQRELRGDVVVGRVAFMQGAIVGGLVGGALSGCPAFGTAPGVIAYLTLRHVIAFPSAGRVGARGAVGGIGSTRDPGHDRGQVPGGAIGKPELLHRVVGVRRVIAVEDPVDDDLVGGARDRDFQRTVTAPVVVVDPPEHDLSRG